MTHKIMGFVDGENLTLRFQDMCKEGATPKDDVIHVPNVLAWHPAITGTYLCDIVRMSYYQTVVGDEQRLNKVRAVISNVRYPYSEDESSSIESSGRLVPRVFKKELKNSKTKSVDINLTVDMLRHAINGQLDVLLLLSGDGDYLPLVEEVSRHGKQVWIAAFSKGFNSQLRFAADEFYCLDDYFFEKPK